MKENSVFGNTIGRLFRLILVFSLSGLATYSVTTIWPLQLLPATGLIASIGVAVGSAVMAMVFMDAPSGEASDGT